MRKLGWNPQTIRLYELRLADFARRVDITTPGGVTQTQIALAADDWLQTKQDRPSHRCVERRRVCFIRARDDGYPS